MQLSLLVIFPTLLEAKFYLKTLQQKLQKKQVQSKDPHFENKLEKSIAASNLPLLKNFDHLLSLQPLHYEEKEINITLIIAGVGIIQPLNCLYEHFTEQQLKSFSLICLSGICAIKNSSLPIGTLLTCKQVQLCPPSHFLNADLFTEALHQAAYPPIDLNHHYLNDKAQLVSCCMTSPWAVKKETQVHISHEKTPLACMVEMEAYPIASMAKRIGTALQIIKVVSDSCDIEGDGAQIATRIPQLSRICSEALIQLLDEMK